MRAVRFKTCTRCKARTQTIFRNTCCRRCYETQRNGGIIGEIKRKFVELAPFNERIFEQISIDLERLEHMRRRDIRILERAVGLLNKETIAQPESWAEARALSDRLRICDGGRWEKWTFGCPILKIAEDLEKEGQINRDHPCAKSIEAKLRSFDQKNRELVQLYYDEDAASGRPSRQMFKGISRLRALYLFLNGKDLLALDAATAQAYFRSLDHLSVKMTCDRMMRLKRFYHWSMKRGLCQINPFDGWHPESLVRMCHKCGKTSVFNSDDRLCDSCYTSTRCLKRLDQLVSSFRAPSPYNQYLLDLYVKHTKRYLVLDTHLVGARAIIGVLEAKPLPVIRSWNAVISLSEELRQKQSRPIPHGCPFIKIGYMLQELGVISIRQTERDHLLENLYSRCDHKSAQVLRQYSDHLTKMKHATLGRYGNVRTVFELQNWLSQNEPSHSLFTVSEKTVISYLQGRRDRDRSGIRRKALNRFYRWARHERLTLMNPVEKIPVPKVQRSICICSDGQIRQIESFVKNPESDPEYAFILALGLYWGLSTVELAMSSIEIRDHQIWITLYRREIRRGRKAHNREQVLKLPLQPSWLAALQKRYIALWRERFEATKKSFPGQPLILGRNKNSRTNRHLHTATVLRLFCEATIAATGESIPPQVVRRTSGHIHTHCSPQL